jgi:hypothetical protein
MADESVDSHQTSSAVKGLSYLSFLAPTRQLFSRTLLFYNSLGIPTVALNGPTTPLHRKQNNGDASNNDDHEAWLHVFGEAPDGEVSVRVTLASEAEDTDSSENYLEKLQEKSRALDKKDVGKELVTFCFSVGDLEVGFFIACRTRTGDSLTFL